MKIKLENNNLTLGSVTLSLTNNDITQLKKVLSDGPVAKKVKVAKNDRVAKKVTLKELQAKIEAAVEESQCGYMYSDLTPQVGKDLSKVRFDFENTEIESTGSSVIGYNTIGDLSFLGVSAGGDWEYPICFIIYDSPKGLRAYIPKDGNPWNYDTKEALGNDEDADTKFLTKMFGPPKYEYYEASDGDGIYNEHKMIEDIKKRIKVV